jgi:hypothetical protein
MLQLAQLEDPLSVLVSEGSGDLRLLGITSPVLLLELRFLLELHVEVYFLSILRTELHSLVELATHDVQLVLVGNAG